MRLLAEALESKAAGEAESSACPDAEVLAAYAEDGPSDREAFGAGRPHRRSVAARK